MRDCEPEGSPLTTPAAALAALSGFDGPVLLDLDETLYLRNSTEDFIDCVRPAILAMILLKLLDLLAPWRWSGGAETRDVWRVGLVRLIFPWTPLLWRRRCATLGPRFANALLLAVMRDRHPLPIVVTAGFLPIVTPLVAAIGLGAAPIVATRLDRFSDRVDGKLALARAALGSEMISRGLVLTDSPSDRPLLDACTLPLQVVWPEARFRPAFAGLYFPGRYLMKVKRPGDRRYIARSILWEDFTLWLLCAISMASLPLVLLPGLGLLLLSFWSIYEQGYADNDRMARLYEQNPTLSASYHTTEIVTPSRAPWFWAATSGLAAIILLRWPSPPSLADFAAWVAFLIVTALWFRLYNRVDKPTRIWLYPGLQLARSAAFLVLLPAATVSPLAIGAHVFAKWLPYIFYRARNADKNQKAASARGWPELPTHLLRLVGFLLLCATVLLCEGPHALPLGTTAALMLFFAYKARGEGTVMLRAAHRIDRATDRSDLSVQSQIFEDRV